MKYGLKTREKIVLFLSLLICPLFTCQIRALALEDDQVIKILSSNPGLFHENGIVASAFQTFSRIFPESADITCCAVVGVTLLLCTGTATYVSPFQYPRSGRSANMRSAPVAVGCVNCGCVPLWIATFG